MSSLQESNLQKYYQYLTNLKAERPEIPNELLYAILYQGVTKLPEVLALTFYNCIKNSFLVFLTFTSNSSDVN